MTELTKDMFYYDLPGELIAQHPVENRQESRLMVLNRLEKSIEHKHFYDIIDYLKPGDVLVRNNTRVIPARLIGKKAGYDREVEIFLLRPMNNSDSWEAMVRPGKKIKTGDIISFKDGILQCKIIKVLGSGNRVVNFIYEGKFSDILDAVGETPLPPYIKEKLTDKERYQTVYSKEEGSVAAPTAGLHFTGELLKKIADKGIKIVDITLHVGIGTFRPVKTENIKDHIMHSEFYEISGEAAAAINDAKKKGDRIIAVGTTVCRTLESAIDEQGNIVSGMKSTDIFIYPGYSFKVIDAIITNFHLPESTLIMLISALYGREEILKAYNEAIKEKYRFFSFGDSMFIY